MRGIITHPLSKALEGGGAEEGQGWYFQGGRGRGGRLRNINSAPVSGPVHVRGRNDVPARRTHRGYAAGAPDNGGALPHPPTSRPQPQPTPSNDPVSPTESAWGPATRRVRPGTPGKPPPPPPIGARASAAPAPFARQILTSVLSCASRN